jgi:glycosyltransferase involved in cell wall biosynthesis
VSHNLNLGEGAPTSLLQTVTGLARTGRVEAAVFSILPGELAQGYEDAGVPVLIPELAAQSRLASKTISLSGPRLQGAFRAALRERRIELVVVNTATALWFADLAQAEGLPTLAMIRESSREHVDFAFGPEKVMAACRRGLERADRVVFVSEHTRRLWAASHALARAVTIPNGIDLARLGAARGESREGLRARLGLAPGEVAILSVGSISARKSQGDIVAAFGSLPPALAARARLLLVGAKPSAYLEALRAQVEALPGDLGRRVHVEPETPDVGAWYRAADLFVLASRNESYPRVVVEALGFGLPVVSSAVFGTREQVVDGVSGLLFEPGDVPALARHLGRLLDDEGLRRAMADAAETRAWELTTFWEMVHRYDVLLRRVAVERAARDAPVRPW